jgi:hypothetical protein
MPDALHLGDDFVITLGAVTAQRWITPLRGMTPVTRRGNL